MLCLVAQSCLILWTATPWTVACQAPLSEGILQAIILEWVAMPSSRGSSQPRGRTQVSRLAGILFTIWATREDLPRRKMLSARKEKKEGVRPRSGGSEKTPMNRTLELNPEWEAVESVKERAHSHLLVEIGDSLCGETEAERPGFRGAQHSQGRGRAAKLRTGRYWVECSQVPWPGVPVPQQMGRLLHRRTEWLKNKGPQIRGPGSSGRARTPPNREVHQSTRAPPLIHTSVQLLSRVRLFVTPWIAAHQASLSITNSRSSLKLTLIYIHVYKWNTTQPWKRMT